MWKRLLSELNKEFKDIKKFKKNSKKKKKKRQNPKLICNFFF